MKAGVIQVAIFTWLMSSCSVLELQKTAHFGLLEDSHFLGTFFPCYTAHKQSLGGVYRNHPVCLSVRLCVRLSGILVNATALKPFNSFHSNFTDKTQVPCRCA